MFFFMYMFVIDLKLLSTNQNVLNNILSKSYDLKIYYHKLLKNLII